MKSTGLPPKQGLYDPRFEHDACGIGFVVNIKGVKSNAIVRQGLTALLNLTHRGARGSEPQTGDGAGILLQTPHGFLQQACAEAGIHLPPFGEYGIGMAFLPPDPSQRRNCEQHFEKIIAEEGQHLLGWRTVPTQNVSLGRTARSCEPCVRQVFIGRDAKIQDALAFERKLYVIRKRAENAIRYSGMKGGEYFYLASLSYKTVVYKGMLTAEQLEEYYPDLSDLAMEAALVLIHSRFSTNTFPSWERAHPYRYLIHNG
ncbi:MAG TPA: glutamate synthase subunit alpha, partial [Candidatus Methylomirabilis sp.]|nr:glutamate synthase subunit alpha [Candidatus Methylomirabilis sp.]